MILSFLNYFIHKPASLKTKYPNPRGFLPRPLLRAGIRIQNHETESDKANHIPRKIVSPCPPQSVKLPRIEFRDGIHYIIYFENRCELGTIKTPR